MITNYNQNIFLILLIILKLNSVKTNFSFSLDNIKIRYLYFLDYLPWNKNKKNLIIGAFTNHPWKVVRNFFISLIKSGFHNYEIVMFIGNVQEETKDKMKQCGVIIYEIPKEYLESKSIIQNYRFKIYEDFLKKNKYKYNKVFTADIKDTIFQKDIFQLFNSSKTFLGFFYEEKIIKETPANIDWAKFYCGKNIKENTFNKKIICSGSIIGSADKFYEFCKILWKIIEDNNSTDYFGEQGAVNCMIHNQNLFNDCVILQDNNGPLMTIGLSKRKNIKLDKNDNIINYKGEIAAAVHQYDRMRDITEKMNNKFDDTNLNFNNFVNSNNNIKSENIFNFLILFAVIIIVVILIFLFYLFIKWKTSKKFFKKIKIKNRKKNNKKIKRKYQKIKN